MGTLAPIYLKMDKLCIRMIQQESGMSISQQKYFRVSVPQSFTGYDLTQWLMNQLSLDDITEAIHIGNLLTQHGYFFPVIDKTAPIKDDSTLYRMQIPYFWVTHNGNPDNIEYAIFLSKRLMRNEERHGLEEYEAEAYNKLRELLGHMWDFITVQAEMQLKLFKEKKKCDKVVLDSQERAFWRLHRTPTGPSSCLEMKYGKAEKKFKKRTLRDLEQEIERLKFANKTKPWLKSPKAVEMLVSWSEQFGDYDPFLVGCHPSNPWISDDPNHWALNTDMTERSRRIRELGCFSVEIPTERRVKRWGFSVQELIRDPIGRQVLETFLESEFSSENIRFWMAVQDLKYSPNAQCADKVEQIFNEYLASGATCQVNVDSRTLEATTRARDDKTVPTRYVFSQAEEHIFILMSKDSYPRFVRSEIYKGVLNAAQQQGSKRLGWRNFLFNMGGKKMSTATAPKLSQVSRLRDEGGCGLPKQLSVDASVSLGISKKSRFLIQNPIKQRKKLSFRSLVHPGGSTIEENSSHTSELSTSDKP